MYRLHDPLCGVRPTPSVVIPLGDGVPSSASLFLPDVEDDAVRARVAAVFPHPDTAEAAMRRGKFPVVLIRTPYDRRNLVGSAYMLAERGFAVVTQDSRGRADSGGDFFPIAHERADSGATLDWIAAQDWCSGAVGMYGISYMGMNAWAAVGAKRGVLKAVVPALCATHLHPILFPGGAPALELVLRWSYLVMGLAAGPAWRMAWNGFVSPEQRYIDALSHLPLATVDTLVGPPGERIDFIRDGLSHPSLEHDAEFWADKNELADLGSVAIPPVHLVGGWHDFFLEEQLKDYEAASAAGATTALTIGPFAHWSVFDYRPMLMRDALAWFTQHLTHAPDELDGAQLDDSVLRSEAEADRGSVMTLAFPVRLYVQGSERWVRYASWPPPSQRVPLYLSGHGVLTAGPAADGIGGDDPHSEYVYDPANPTPAVGGPSFHNLNAGRVAQNGVEARDDVLVFTSVPLGEDISVVGYPELSMRVASNAPGSTDFVFRLCDVDADGVSYNVSESNIRLSVESEGEADGASGLNHFAISGKRLGAVGYTFCRGHRIRLQVCSGAHPRLMRNLGYDDPLVSAERMVVQQQRVYHRGASLALPVVNL
ncbi:X-Pro dipeptidyl-peptidase domain-containing protein, partial [Thecamonas trahens ATCC 50062]